ncbi:hypothetical protein [Hyphomicrobium sp. D-2]|uniref:hypothetical protein n=1 Tax=Hyphomicrobium sp. D-2 TaxID=3041621 RepID=UPI0024566B33|nr:hypothetical protein [Hyphomicrobium sp. D-2]MDH4983268.1 hypothetical protein [Hyphomicrobium sp. D-2]
MTSTPYGKLADVTRSLSTLARSIDRERDANPDLADRLALELDDLLTKTERELSKLTIKPPRCRLGRWQRDSNAFNRGQSHVGPR